MRKAVQDIFLFNKSQSKFTTVNQLFLSLLFIKCHSHSQTDLISQGVDGHGIYTHEVALYFANHWSPRNGKGILIPLKSWSVSQGDTMLSKGEAPSHLFNKVC